MPTHDRDMLTAVVEAAQNGDVAAYGNLVEKTQRLIGDTVRRLIHDPDDAEDAVQDTYLRAYRQLDSLRHPQAAIPWLQRIARSVSLNQQRARRLSFVDADVSELAAAEPVHPSGSATDDASLQQALVLLSPEERRLCERYYYGGWPTARLADDMALSEAAVRKRMQRIRDRLREEMTMGESALPEKIVELLSRPNLTALPDNPVGAIWSEFQTAFTGFDEVELPERLEREALAELFGDADPEALRCYLGSLERQDWLRSDLTKPMLLAARGTPGAARHIATGKTYRLGDDESQAKLHAFHQAEALWIEEGLDEWGLMSPMTAFLDRLTSHARLRITQTDFPLDCAKGWTVDAEWRDGEWQAVCAWGRVRDPVVRRLGLDPRRYTALGVGMGLERLACLRYDIDDIRKVAAARV